MGTTQSEYKDAINSLSKYFKKEASKHNVQAKLRSFSFDATKALVKLKNTPFFDGVSECVIDALLSMNYIKISIVGIAIFAFLL